MILETFTRTHTYNLCIILINIINNIIWTITYTDTYNLLILINMYDPN